MNSVHKVSSFNNQSYSFAVNNTREFLKKRDGHHQESRFCAACHDPVVLFSGEFDKDIDFTKTEIGQAGITCTACHAISKVNSIKGNGAYTLDIPEQYPFTYSEMPFLQWINQTLVKAKPDFHKTSYLKPLHKTSDFCSTCHKVSIPESFNNYKWLRGQNHYDSFFLSGVSGHAVASFYYPPKAKEKCADCHMPFQDSDDFGSITESFSGKSKVHSHFFESANSGIRYLNNLKPDPNNEMLKGSLSIDIFGVKQDGNISGELIAPLMDETTPLQAGRKYLLESVVRTVKLGHAFTQGTSDSNQVWVEMKVYHNGQLIGLSGGINDEGQVDDWSYLINAYVLDKQGNRIDRRNVEDIWDFYVGELKCADISFQPLHNEFRRCVMTFVRDEWEHMEQIPYAPDGKVIQDVKHCADDGDMAYVNADYVTWKQNYLQGFSVTNSPTDFFPYDLWAASWTQVAGATLPATFTPWSC
jgi:hypothetical protein